MSLLLSVLRWEPQLAVRPLRQRTPTSISVRVLLLLCRRLRHSLSVTGSFKVKFHGDASWLYNVLLKLLQGTLRKAIAKGVNGALTNAINNA